MPPKASSSDHGLPTNSDDQSNLLFNSALWKAELEKRLVQNQIDAAAAKIAVGLFAQQGRLASGT